MTRKDTLKRIREKRNLLKDRPTDRPTDRPKPPREEAKPYPSEALKRNVERIRMFANRTNGKA
jgi:hypothetical protein